MKIKNKTSSVLTLGKSILYATSLALFAFVMLLSSYFISKGELNIGAMVFILLIINNTHRLLLSPVPLKNDYEEYKKSNEIISELMKPDQKTMPIGINDFKSIVFELDIFSEDSPSATRANSAGN